MDRPIKILFLAANPKDTSQLRLDEEMRAIDQVLHHSEFRDRFDVRQQWAVRIIDLQGYLLRHKPNIVHFSGHGNASNEIILEDNNGNSQPVSSHALSQLFSVLKDNIRCVVLNACYSEQQAKDIAKYIDCVIGMSKAVGDSAAISFASAFYQAIGYGKDVKTAFDLGCVQIDLERLEEQDKPRLLAINSNPHEIVFVRDSFIFGNYTKTDEYTAINTPQKPNSKISTTEELIIQTQRTEYTNFVVFNPDDSEIPIEIPDYSFAKTSGGMIAHPVALSEIGLDSSEYENKFPPHIPEGEMIIDFTILNQGQTAIVNKISIELLQTTKVPKKSLLSQFMPVLEPTEDIAVLTQGQKLYHLFEDKIFSYKSGDVDLFRVNVLISDKDLPAVFKFRFEVHYTINSISNIAYSNIFYLVKYRPGLTSKIPFIKKHPSRNELEIEKLLAKTDQDSSEKSNFFTDGNYYESIIRYINCDLPLEIDFLKYITSNYWHAVMEGKRDPIQIYGVHESKSQDPIISQITKEMSKGLHTSWITLHPKGDRDYRTRSFDNFEVYHKRETEAYHCLLLACKRLSETGAEEEHERISKFLFDMTQSSEMDAAGVIDTIPLLSFFRNEISFEYLVYLLDCDHPIVEEIACEIFEAIKYDKSTEALLRLVKKDNSYARSKALFALGMNGNKKVTQELVELFEQEHFHDVEIPNVAHVLIRISKKFSINLIQRYSNSTKIKKRNLAYYILKELKRS